MVADPDAFNVLLVCHSHTGRALLAERLLRPALAAQGFEADAIRVTSAGLANELAAPAAEVVEALEAQGGAAGGFVARSLDAGIVAEADVILALAPRTRDSVVDRFAGAAHKTFTMAEYLAWDQAVNPVVPLAEHPVTLNHARSAANEAPASLAELGPKEPQGAEQWSLEASQIAGMVRQLVQVWMPLAPASARVTPSYLPAHSVVTVALEALEVPIDVKCSGEGGTALARSLAQAWSRCGRADGSGELEIHIVIDHREANREEANRAGRMAFSTVAEALHALSSLITVHAINARAGELVMIHAAGIALPDGRVVAFAAPSGTGKTTLSNALGKAFGYVTDETLAVRRDGSVLPYPKPLSVVQPGSGMKAQVSPDEAGLKVPPAELRLAAVVLLNRVRDEQVDARATVAELLDGLVELAPQVSYLSRLDSPLRTLANLVQSVGGVQIVTYSQVDDLSDLVPGLVGRAAA